MKLKLLDGEIVEIFRQTCGYQYQVTGKNTPTVEWNINPVQIVEDERKGYFVIGRWGSGGYQGECGQWVHDPSEYEKMIPVKSVLYIMEPHIWEMPEYVPQV